MLRLVLWYTLEDTMAVGRNSDGYLVPNSLGGGTV